MGLRKVGDDANMRQIGIHLRHRSRGKSKGTERHRPLVGVVVNCSTTYGRSILRGAVRYANLQRRWVVYKALERTFDVKSNWPEFDGAIFAGIPSDVFNLGL